MGRLLIASMVVAIASTACTGAPTKSTHSPTPPATLSSPSPTPSPLLDPPTDPLPTQLSGPALVRPELIAYLNQPLAMAFRMGDGAMYVATKTGEIWAIRKGVVDPKPLLDISAQVSSGGEQGLLGLVFSPDGRYLYINYTDRAGDTNVVEFAWVHGHPDLSTRREILFVEQPYANHNGGDLVFGPDGYLYIGMGDGGSDYTHGDPQGDPNRNGQNLGVLLAKMLRIQPRMPDGSLPPGPRPYAVPPDNPFVHRTGARAEIWAYGLKNPWRYSFDRKTGDLWSGDVGAGDREEIDMQSAGSGGGQNYGWNAVEGNVQWREPPPDAVPPLYTYPHTGSVCAVVGGFVYRGQAIPSLRGRYVFTDYCSASIRALQLTSGGAQVRVISHESFSRVVAFGEDPAGELYALSLDGGIYRLAPA